MALSTIEWGLGGGKGAGWKPAHTGLYTVRKSINFALSLSSDSFLVDRKIFLALNVLFVLYVVSSVQMCNETNNDELFVV